MKIINSWKSLNKQFDKLEVCSEAVANQINQWLVALADKFPDLPEPEFTSTPDGEIQLSWSNASAHFVVTSQSWKAKARYEDLSTRNVERAVLEWGGLWFGFSAG